jgi:hypothetical protein
MRSRMSGVAAWCGGIKRHQAEARSKCEIGPAVRDPVDRGQRRRPYRAHEWNAPHEKKRDDRETDDPDERPHDGLPARADQFRKRIDHDQSAFPGTKRGPEEGEPNEDEAAHLLGPGYGDREDETADYLQDYQDQHRTEKQRGCDIEAAVEYPHVDPLPNDWRAPLLSGSWRSRQPS